MAKCDVEPFAIVGLSFKMPQEAVDETGFWQILESRKNLMTEWPENRANVDSFYDNGSKKPNTLHGRGAHFVKEEPGVFDAPFFSISAKEASAMDPQQRWALEASYHALENAGIPLETIHGSSTGVFASSFSDEYARLLGKDPDTAPTHTGIGTACSVVPNRVSWFFNLCGPSVHIDTACSSGLVALDMACQSLQCGESTAALVIGSSLLLSPELTTLLANMNFLSPDSRCYSFDSRANGFARGEGIVALVVKPLQSALNHGDTIRAVIRATASNQDGRTPGLTQPSAEAQESLIRRTYAKAGLDFGSTRYVEAHGTGTAVGDPAEMQAIGSVFRASRSTEEPLFVGSVKANIGHLEAASGLAGIVKCIMILEKAVIPPNALFEKLNPQIDGDFLNIRVPTHCIPWPACGPRRVSVSSFGFGGTNSHVVLDDALHYLQRRSIAGCHHTVESPTAPNANGVSTIRHTKSGINGVSPTKFKHSMQSNPRLLVWSAADRAAIQRTQHAYQQYYKDHVGHSQYKLSQLAYTLAARRTIMPWRTFAVVSNDDMRNGYAEENAAARLLLDMAKPVRASGDHVSIGFVFTGQSAQYAGMGSDLQQYHVFSRSLEKSDEILASLGCKWSALDILHDGDRIHYPEFSQSLCTILQLAIVDLLRSFKVTPVVVAGHSSGEIAAAYAAGALSHESACKVAYHRGQVAEKVRISSKARPGSMISVNLTQAEVATHLKTLEVDAGTISIACVNSPTNLTLAGASDAIDALKTRLDQRGIFAHKVNTGVAYHTPAMLTVADEYEELLGDLEMASDIPQPVPMVSSVTGRTVPAEDLTRPRYWVDNLISPVKFCDAIRYIGDHGPLSKLLPSGVGAITDLIEVGPHSALRRPIKDTVPSLRYHSVIERTKSSRVTVLNVLGELFCNGHAVSVLEGNGQTNETISCLTDCPSYPFDHSRRYWAESRFSRDYRLRPLVSGHVLGRPSHDWNPLQPRWRNWICTETMPWLADHVINDVTVFPGTGMLVMALEAARSAVVSKGRSVTGFLLKDAQFLAPILVGKDLQDSPETTIELRPILNVHEKESLRSEVRLYSTLDGTWTLNFRAEVEVQSKENTDQDLAWTDETHHENTRIREHVTSKSSICTSHLDHRYFYRFCGKQGLRYGPSFQLLREIAWDGNQTSTARIEMRPIPTLHGLADSPVHPAILDAALHLLLVQASNGAGHSISTFVPRRIANMWISSRHWESSTSSLELCSLLRNQAAGTGVSGTVDLVDDKGNPLCSIKDVMMVEVSRPSHSDDDHDRGNHSLLHSISWRPQFSSLDADALNKLCKAQVQTWSETVQQDFYPKMELAMRVSARKALRDVSKGEISQASGYIKRYVASLEYRYGAPSSAPEEIMSDSMLEDLLQECENEQPHWRMFPAVARALPSIIRGKSSALELLFSSKAAEEFYFHVFDGIARNEGFGKFLDLATHENPGLSILEVGAGTGSMTRSILTTLGLLEQQTGQTRFSEFTYTDISLSFFEQSRKKFQDFEDRLTFRTLNLEQDPLEQGYQAAAYDMVFAGNVLHATSDLLATLKRCHKLLKPGGQLIFFEITSLDSACANIGFGSLEGWWSGSEEWRQHGPLATDSHWDELLRQSGFSGTDLVLRDFESDVCHLNSLVVAKALAPSANKIAPNGIKHSRETDITVLIDHDSDVHKSLTRAIRLDFPDAREVSYQDKPTFESGIVVSLLDYGAQKLAKLDGSDLEHVRSHIQKAENLVWVTYGRESGVSDPHASLANGFLRVLRNEMDSKRIITLSIESCPMGSEADYVVRALRASFFSTPQSQEVELLVRDGVFTIGRLVQEKQLDAERVHRIHPQIVSETWEPGPSLTAEFRSPGMLDSLQFVEVEQDRALAPDEVEMKAAVWPISFRDLFIALGRLRGEKMGFECAGTVSRVGSACMSEFAPGDRVLMVVPGCMTSHPRAPVHSVFKLQDDVTFHDAVAGMNPGMTAWYALTCIARLQPGDKVLIHSAAGATGQMAVKIAKLIGAEVFATVGSDHKRQLVMSPDGLNIPESHIFYSRDTSFAAGIMRVTGGRGVDVVLNSLSGSNLQASWQCIAPYGRFVDIGKSDIEANSSLPMAGFARNVSFASVDLHHIVQTNASLTRELVEKSLQLSVDKSVGVPAPLHLFPISELEKALRYMQSGKNTGRILVTIHPDDVVPKSLVHRCDWKFKEHASYLVAGGLGGLGRAIIRWMGDRGAMNIIVPSRSGPTSQPARDVISELSSKGINVLAPRCDISSATEIEALLKDCAHMPPIRGCVNLTMCLHNALFESMTPAQWTESLRPKVSGSWNLHEQLRELDFFILVSSLSGIIGAVPQSNYAAGNTFQDALARMRASIGGLGTSVSLDLGWVQDAGWVNENTEHGQERTISRYFDPVQVRDLLAVLEHFCDPSISPPTPEQSQLLIGAKTPDDFRARGETVPFAFERPLFSAFNVVRPYAATDKRAAATASSAEEDARQLFRQAADSEQRASVVTDALQIKISRALAIETEDVDTHKRLMDYGVDSLMAVELRNWVWWNFGVSIAVFEIMDAARDLMGVGKLVAEKAE